MRQAITGGLVFPPVWILLHLPSCYSNVQSDRSGAEKMRKIPCQMLVLLLVQLGWTALASAAPTKTSEPVPTIQVADVLDPAFMEDLDRQLGELGRYPPWDALIASIEGRPAGEARRYTLAVVRMRRAEVDSGQKAEDDLWAMHRQLSTRTERNGKVLAALVLLAIGEGQLQRSHHPEAVETLRRSVEALRALDAQRGLVRALYVQARAILHATRRPADGLAPINELLVVADKAGMQRYIKAADRLYGEWRVRQVELDDYFGRAENRLETFPPSLGIPVDADLVAVHDGVIVLNGDTDDQAVRADPKFVRFDGRFVRELVLPNDDLELRGSTLDADGVLWAATNRGLFAYDGTGFVQWVNRELADEEGNHLAKALAKKNPGFERRDAPLRSNVVNEIKQAPDGRLFMATRAGVAIWKRGDKDQAGQWSFITKAEAPIPDLVERVAPLADGGLVVAWKHEYAVRDNKGRWKRFSFEFPVVNGMEPGSLYGLLTDREGKAWVHGLVGGKRLSGQQTTRVVDREFAPMTRNLNHVLLASDGAWWFATAEGVCRQDGRSCAAVNSKRWLPAQWSLDLLEWPEGDIWVTVYQGGLHRLLHPSYRQYSVADGFIQPMNTDLELMGGKLFFANPRGLSRFDPQSGRFDHFRGGNEGMPKGIFQTDLVLGLSDERIAYTGRGMSRSKNIGLFDGRRSQVFADKAGLPDEEIHSICEHEKGILLIAYHSGLRALDLAASSVSSVDLGPALAGVEVESLICKPGGPIWLTDHDDRLFRAEGGLATAVDLNRAGLQGELKVLIDGDGDDLFAFGERSALRHHQGRWSVLPVEPDHFDFRVRDVVSDERDWLYFSTESGVFVFDGEMWTRLGVEDGLISDTAFDMAWVGERLWITGQGGAVAWSWPEQWPPETYLIAEQQAWYVDPNGQARRLKVSDGVDKPGRVQLKGTAGLFELTAEQAGSFLDSTPPGVQLGEGKPSTFDHSDLVFQVSAGVPYLDDKPDQIVFHHRLDGGAWQRLTGLQLPLTGLSDGAHLVEVRASDPRLKRDSTPAQFRFVVDTPIPPWQIASISITFVFGLFLGRRRISRAYRRFHHRKFSPIEPSPFCPDRPAEGSAFVGREAELGALTHMVGSGGVGVLWGPRGTGKNSVLRALSARLVHGGKLVVELDLTAEAAGGDVASLMRALANRCSELAESLGLSLGPGSSEDRSSPGSGSSGDRLGLDPSMAASLALSSGSGGDNPFAHLARVLQHLERERPEVRLALLLGNAEVLGLAMESDAAYGSYFFPFLRSLVQQRRRLSVILSLEGRWFELARKFRSLFSFATPVGLDRFDAPSSAGLLIGALEGRAWLADDAAAAAVELAGGNPYLLQLVGHGLVGALNMARTNLCDLARVEQVADGLVADPEGRLKGTWLSFERDEKMVVAGLCELSTELAVPIQQLVERLEASGGKLLFEEARRALLALQKDGVVEVEQNDCRLRCGLFRRWVQHHHSLESVLEESVDTVAHYQLVHKLGAGGMGVVYKARDMVKGKTVAVKLLRSEMSESKRSRLRFLREAKLGKRLKHPNIVRILDYGEQGGRLYLAMELLEGVSLARWIRKHRPVTLFRAVEIGRHLAAALRAIHDLGVVHRDIKSDNIMLAAHAVDDMQELLPGSVKLMDFGLAVGADVSRMTRAGSLLGTLSYMAPEQARGEEADKRSDLYAMGVVLYELCVGRPPFVGPETVVLNALLNEPVPDLRELRPDVPPALVQLIEGLLSKDPAQRPEDAGWVGERLDEIFDALPDEANAPVQASIAQEADHDAETIMPASDWAEIESNASAIHSRTLDAMKLESVLLGSISTAAGDESVGSVVDPRSDQARQLIYRVSAEVARGHMDDDRLGACLADVMKALGGERGLVALHDGGTEGMRVAAWQGHEDVDLLRLPTFSGLMHKCVQEQMGLVYSGPFEEQGQEFGNVVCAPLWAVDSIQGAMLLDRPGLSSVAFEDSDLELLVCLGYLLGLGLERERLFRRVLDRERLAAVGTMLAGVAHDMKNPMAVIAGYAELVPGMPDEPSRLRCADVIRRQVGEMNDMITNLMAYVRGDSVLHLGMLDLADLAEDLRESLSVQCEPRKIDLIVDGDEGGVRVDPVRCKRILLNLARNSLEAMQGGGRLLVQLKVTEDVLVCRVRDNGRGIPRALREKLFDPFVTEGKKGGTGLGLAIVRRFIDDQAGTIEVQSQMGVGTTFTVRVPGMPTPDPIQAEDPPAPRNTA